MKKLVVNKDFYKKVLLIIIINTLFFNCQCSNEIKELKQNFIEISFQKAFIWYSEDIVFGWSPRRVYIETKIISHINDTTLLLVADKQFHEPFIKSCIATIINQDTVLLSPGLWSNKFEAITILPKDTIEQRFSYIIDAYISQSLKGANRGKSVSIKKSKEVDKALIMDLLNAPLIYIPYENEYENKDYYWENASVVSAPKVIFTKAKTFKIFAEDYRTLRCEDCH